MFTEVLIRKVLSFSLEEKYLQVKNDLAFNNVDRKIFGEDLRIFVGSKRHGYGNFDGLLGKMKLINFDKILI
jgi:hypothetical protein